MRLRWLTLAAGVTLVSLLHAQPIKQIWHKPLSDPFATISVHRGRVLLHSSKDVRLLDAASGRLLATLPKSQHAVFEKDILLLAVQTPGTHEFAVEARSLKGALLWRVPYPRPMNLGGTRAGKLFVSDELGIHRLDITSGALEQSREVQWSWRPPAVHVIGRRVYAGVSGHEVYGLVADDLRLGWRNYCEGSPDHIDETGFVGVGTYFHLVSVAESGETRFAPPASLSLIRQPVVVGRSLIVAGGNLIAPALTIQPYLFGIDFGSGAVRWKKPMFALQPVAFKRSVAVLAGHRIKPGLGDYSAYNARADDNLMVQFELRDLATGRLEYTLPKSWIGRDLQMVSDGLHVVISDGKQLVGLR